MKNKQYRIIFFGTPEFSAIILKKLINSPFSPIAVVTASDKPEGRKQILIPSKVKKLSIKENISVLQPTSLRNNPQIVKELTNLKSDLFIVAAYGLILPKEVLNIPKKGCINIHPSLLPKYRGASPIQETILNGDQETGTTLILMDEKMDHGAIISQKELKGGTKSMTCPELNVKLANLSADLLMDILPEFLMKQIKVIPQNHKQATFVKKIDKGNGKIDWTKSATEIERMTRAYRPWPGTYTTFMTKKIKIIQVEILEIDHQKQPGTIFFIESKIPAVACGKNALILKEIQLAGKNIITGKEFANGYPQLFSIIMR